MRANPAAFATVSRPTVAQIEQPENAAPLPSLSTLAELAPAHPVPAAKAAPGSSEKPSVPAQEPASIQVSENAGPSQAQAQLMNLQLNAPARIHLPAAPGAQAPPPSGGIVPDGMDGSGNNSAIGGVFSSAKQFGVLAAPPRVLNVSSAVAFGLLIRKTPPIYPRFARDSGLSGTVVLLAQISKSGTIEDLRVVSGPEMLRQAALNAVRTWRYKPYVINNRPTAIETTIEVAFSLAE
ncbi:MAG TPA: TonB family protein [Terracidiphilus sp.]|nr:TonB family protein [Terracidiphilus sp.]